MEFRSSSEIMTIIKRYMIENHILFLEPLVENCIIIDISPKGMPKITWERRHTLNRSPESHSNLSFEEGIDVLNKAIHMVEISLNQLMDRPRMFGRLQLTIGRGQINASCE